MEGNLDDFSSLETILYCQYSIDHYFSCETEVWNLSNESGRLINPKLQSGHYIIGVGLYIVPFDFCTP